MLTIPANWEEQAGPEGSLAAKTKAGPPAEEVRVALADSVTGAIVRVGSFDRRLLAARDFPEWATQEVQRECDASSGAGISEKWLLVQDVRVVQLMLTDSAWVRFRIFAEGEVPVVVQYELPQGTIQQTLPYVETTLSSMRRAGAAAG